MSAISNDIISDNAKPNNGEPRSKLFGCGFEKSAFRPGFVSQDYNRLKMFGSINNFENILERGQTLRTVDEMSELEKIRSLGLKSRTTEKRFHSQEGDLRANEIMNETHHRSHMSTISRTFGLISEDLNGLNSQNNGRLNQEWRRSNVYSSVMQRPFRLLKDDSRADQGLSVMNCGDYLKMPEMSKASENNVDNEGFSHHLKINSNINSFSESKVFGLQSRNLSSYSGLFPDRSFRLNQDSNHRIHNISTISKAFGPGARNTTLTTELQMQDRIRYNDHSIDDGGFRRPALSRVIKGRNSTLSSRLLHDQRHGRDLSNFSSVNVSHMPRREGDFLSESRFALNTRFNGIDNQSIAGSFVSVASIKSQFMSVFESLHSSILNIGPRLTAEAVRAEIERAKQKLEIISERSFALSVKDTGENSVISQSSKYICPSVHEPSAVLNTINGGSLHLKSSKDLLKSLISGKDEFGSLTQLKEGGKRKTRTSFGEDSPTVVFKKPKPYTKRGLRSTRVKKAEEVKKVTSKATDKVINLQQWYPIANGPDLVLCGVNKEGAVVKTEAIKKRLNNRRVELDNGVTCNLIGSPSTMISELPRKITALMKNGLTERWRVLQRELLNCQTIEEEKKKRISKSPRVLSTPVKKKRILVSVKAKGSPEKKNGTLETPIAPRSPEKKRILETPRATTSPEKKKRILETPRATMSPEKKKKVLATPKSVSSPKKKRISESPKIRPSKRKRRFSQNFKTKSSPENKSKKIAKKKRNIKNAEVIGVTEKKETVSEFQTRSGRTVKPPSMFWISTSQSNEMISVKNPQEYIQEREDKEIDMQLPSKDGPKRQDKVLQARRERKRKIEDFGDGDSVQSKKSKMEKKTQVKVKVRVEVGEQAATTTKKKKTLKSKSPATSSPKPKKLPSVSKKGRTVKKKIDKIALETNTETEEMLESEGDFEFSLGDIHVPEVARLSEDPLLSRSQLRLAAMETPPLKYFNSNLKLLRSATPVQSPDWYISQRTESEARKFQKRREEAFKKSKIDVKKTVIQKTKTVHSTDLKRMMDWVAEKTVRSPQWNSKVLQYVMPSRKQMELEENEDEDENENVETGFP